MKITEEEILNHIKEKYFQKIGKKTTLCLLTLDNWFEIVTSSSCIDELDYDQLVWEKIAYEKAIDKCWELYWFLEHNK